MYALYVIKSLSSKPNLYKIGIHTGTITQLKKRYITYIPDLVVVSFNVFDNLILCKKLESDIKTKYKQNRRSNTNGNLSEWFIIDISIISRFISEHAKLKIEHSHNKTIPMTDTRPPSEQPSLVSLTIQKIQELELNRRLIRPPYQRAVDTVRCEKIKDYIINHHTSHTFVFPRIVLNNVIYPDDPPEKSTFTIIDGQHRIEGLLKISAQDQRDNKLENFEVHIDMRINLSIAGEKQMFKAINKSVPCPYFVLCGSDEKKILIALKEFIYREYGNQLSNSPRCKIPNLHLESILEEIGRQNIIAELYKLEFITNAVDLMDGIRALNEHVKNKLTGPTGLATYKRYGSRICAKHTQEYFDKMLVGIKKKEGDYNTCYLGFIPCKNWVQYIYAHHMYC